MNAELKLRSLIDELKAQPKIEHSLLAQAYEMRCFVRLELAKRARVKKAAWTDGACNDYRQALVHMEKGPICWALSGSFTNLGSMLYGLGRYEEALEYHVKALSVAGQLSDPHGAGRLAGWNHYAGTLLKLNRLEEAEQVLKDALTIVSADNPHRVFLLKTLSEVHEAKAANLRQEAEALGNASCGMLSRPQDTIASGQEVCAEFSRLYAKPELGIVTVQVRQDQCKLDLGINNWELAYTLPIQAYRGYELVFGWHLPEGAIVQPAAILVDGPGPELRRQTPES
ncbi:MAG: tetratricopeptide repeat protein [Candidatus Obscuribacterales bacterium]|nr:tetratricopeptide repeat protein [Candidatus Obscuribacterales bacterium]